MLGLFRDLYRRRELLAILVGRNLKIRYKNSVLGFFWSLLVPVFLIVIYALFLRVMKFSWPLPMLVTGIIVWQFFAMSLGDALHAIVGNANLVTKSAFPRVVLPAATVLANFVNFMLSGVVLVGFLLVVSADFSRIHWLPVAILAQLALVLGIALLFSVANVFFRDTEHLVSMILLAWFFMTPVIYPLDVVLGHPGLPQWIETAFFMNPMTGIVSVYRMALLGEASPGLATPGARALMISFGMAAAILAAGLGVFHALQNRLGDEL